MSAPVSTSATTVDLDIAGMTCASCANRIERKLNKLDGVSATVNYATEKASVSFEGVTVDDLIGTVEAAGYRASVPVEDAERPDEARTWLRRLLVSAALTVPVVVLAMGFGARWPTFALTLPVFVYGGWPFHRAAWINLRHGTTTMDTLVSLGTLAAFGWSCWELVHGGELYFEAAAVVTTLLLLGRWAELRTRRRAGDALRSLADLGAREVTLEDGTLVPVDSLRVGTRFVVRPGEKVATDGVVESGTSTVDESMLTGESVPVEVAPESEVTGGCVNHAGRLVVRATRVGRDTRLAQLAKLLEDAQSGKAPVQRLADRVSGVFVPAVLVVALATLVVRLAMGLDAISAAVAVLIIACPCALGLATPTALLVGTGRGAQLGLLIRGPEVLEATRAVDVVVLDKTGTVTSGELSVAATTLSDDDLRLAAAVESFSEHPVGRAVAATLLDRQPAGSGPSQLRRVPDVVDFLSTPGVGVEGTVEGHRVTVGRGTEAIEVRVDGDLRGTITVRDTVKPTSREAVSMLKSLGLDVVLLTGDTEAAARPVAAEVGIERLVAAVLPQGKVDTVRSLQAQGKRVAMVGDGVNDAAALAQADLGIAMGTGTDLAMQASDLTVVSGDLRKVYDAIRLARATLRTIKGNLFWAFAYNVAAIPLAASGLLNPMIAAGAMAFSSVFVVANSLRLRRFS